MRDEYAGDVQIVAQAAQFLAYLGVEGRVSNSPLRVCQFILMHGICHDKLL
jgi:hypothetical protein